MEGIDPGTTALPAVPENDDFDLSDIMLSQLPTIADAEEVSGGVVTAKASSDVNSLPRVLTHKPAMSTCEACMVGMIQHLRTYKGAFSRPTKGFGDTVTMDHCSFYDHGMQYALNGNLISLVVRDVHTKYGAAYPVNKKAASSTVQALQRFIGDSNVKRFYSDNADELVAAARQGVPETNGIIEREVQGMLSGTRTIMFAASLPGYVWSFAVPC